MPINRNGRMMPTNMGNMRGLNKPPMVIDADRVRAASKILEEYKQGKAVLDERIVANDDWYRIRHWNQLKDEEKSEVKSISGWLFNTLANKHADAMDNFPSPNILPREESDKAEAEMLSSIVPVVMDRAGFLNTYSEVVDSKNTNGAGYYGVFWDGKLLNGLGDISIKHIDVLGLFWEPGQADIQESENIFNVALVNNSYLEAEYPQVKGQLTSNPELVKEYHHDDSLNAKNKSLVIDWYYKKYVGNKKILHYCKYVGDIVLFASENDPQYAEKGYYDHGLYPFVPDILYKIKNYPAGFGYVDIGKSAQEYIDRGESAILQNMLANTKPRHFIRDDGSVNEAEYADMSKDFVHVNGNLGQDSIMPIIGKPLNTNYINVVDRKIDELKETTGNRDVSNGGTTSGVTAASALAAMQEAGAKLSRDANRTSYEAYKNVCYLVIELIRQFYDLPRYFRILGRDGTEKFVQYSNQGIVPQLQPPVPGTMEEDVYRIPVFDIEVTAQKASPYTKLSQNELALQFYGAGFFNPSRADEALACLEMMDFDRKSFVMNKISQNGGMLQQMMMLAQMVDQMRGTDEVTASLARQYGVSAPQSPQIQNTENIGESGVTKKARERVAESTAPR